MDIRLMVDTFSHYSRNEQIELLVTFAHALTVLARDTYEAGAEGLANPARLRRINELQHRVTSFLLGLLQDGKRYPEDVFLRMLLEQPDDLELGRQIQQALDHLIKQETAA